MRYIIPISGKDSLATAIVQSAKEPDLPYEYIFCDVGVELPETYAWLNEVERKLCIKLLRIGKSLHDIIEQAGILPSHQKRFCTKYGKIFPIRDYLGKDEAVQYLGIRADENRAGAGFLETGSIHARYPLVEMGINLPMVYKILGDRGLLPPSFFWQRLRDDVYEAAGDVSKQFIDSAPPWVTSSLFSWRSRSNCFLCFYQRMYEWLGLLEFHPDLFAKAEAMENMYGGDGFYWVKDRPLWHIRARREELFTSRVQQVLDMVVKTRHTDGEIDMLAMTSCGLMCGK